MTILISKQAPRVVALVAVLGAAITGNSRSSNSLDEALELDVQIGISSAPSTAPAWTCETAATHDGIDDVAVSPIIDHDENSSFEVLASGADTISFWWKVSSEEIYDTLSFSVDGVMVEEIAGDIPWTNVVVSIPASASVLRWEYSKDDSFSEGQDRGWVDDLRFASKSPPLIEYPSFSGAYLDQIFEIEPQVFSPADSFAFSGSPPSWLALDASTGRIHGTPTSSGDFNVEVSASNAIGTSPTEFLNIRSADLGNGLETIRGGWHWSGAQPWFTQQAVSHDGVDALRSGSIGDNESSELRLPVNGPALVNFWWRVDSEGGHDKLEFLIDGVPAKDTNGQAAEIDDLVEWQARSVAVPAGDHVISWRYQKDDADIEGDDAAWLDSVEIIDGSDPDGDGIPSLLELLLGQDWQTSNPSSLQNPTELDGKLSWQITKGVPVAGIEAIVEISYDLQTWSASPLEVLVDNDSQLQVREATANPSKRKFVRIRAVTTVE